MYEEFEEHPGLIVFDAEHGEKCEISYKEKHLVDLQSLLDALDNNDE